MIPTPTTPNEPTFIASPTVGGPLPLVSTDTAKPTIASLDRRPEQAAKPLSPARASYIDINKELGLISTLNFVSTETIRPRGIYYLLLLVPFVGWAAYGAIYYDCYKSHTEAKMRLGENYEQQTTSQKVERLTKIIEDKDIHPWEKLKYRLERSKLRMVESHLDKGSNIGEIIADLKEVNKPWWAPVNNTALSFEMLTYLSNGQTQEAASLIDPATNHFFSNTCNQTEESVIKQLITDERLALSQQKIVENPNCQLDDWDMKIVEDWLCDLNADCDSEIYEKCHVYIYNNLVNNQYSYEKAQDKLIDFLLRCRFTDLSKQKEKIEQIAASTYKSKSAKSDAYKLLKLIDTKKDQLKTSKNAEDKIRFAKYLYNHSNANLKFQITYQKAYYRDDVDVKAERDVANDIVNLLLEAQNIKPLDQNSFSILGTAQVVLAKNDNDLTNALKTLMLGEQLALDSFFESEWTQKRTLISNSPTAEDKIAYANYLYTRGITDKEEAARTPTEIASLLTKANSIKPLGANDLAILGGAYLSLSKTQPELLKPAIDKLTGASNSSALACKFLADHYKQNKEYDKELQFRIQAGNLGDQKEFYLAGQLLEQGKNIAEAKKYYQKAPAIQAAIDRLTAIAVIEEAQSQQKTKDEA